MAHFADCLKSFGVEQEAMPLEAPWKNGKVEKAGGVWKDIFTKVVHEMQLNGIQDVTTATAIITQTRNGFPRSSRIRTEPVGPGKATNASPGQFATGT